jgi:hypothetical protein
MNCLMAATLLFVMICAANGAATASAQGAPASNANGGQADGGGPLTKSGLLKMLLLGDTSPQEMARIVARRGVNFQPTPADEREIHDAGATDALIVAVRSNFRGAAQDNAAAAQQSNVAAGANDFAAQAPPQTGAAGGPAQPEKKKRSFLEKLNAGMDRANAKLNKVNEQVNKQAQAAQAATAQAAQTVQSIQGQAAQTALSLKAQASQTAQSAKATGQALAPSHTSAPATNEAQPASPSSQVEAPANSGASAAPGSAIQNATSPGATTPNATPPSAQPPDRPQSNLAGTSWDLLSMTKKGEQEKQSGTTPNVQFCRDGSWAILHNGYSEGGKYQMQGARLVMHNSDGSLYGDYQIGRSGSEMILDDGTWTLRLRYYGAVKC